MATLQQVIAGDSRFASTPLASFAIQQYLTNNKLFNLLNFVPIATKNNQGVFSYSYNIFNSNASSVGFRDLGSEPTASNNVPTQGKVDLAILSGAITVDIQMMRGSVPGSIGGSNSYVQEQMALKTDDIMNAFAKNFIQGNSDTSGVKQFDGLEKLVPAKRTNTTAIDVGTMKDEDIRKADAQMRSLVNAVVRPNCIITNASGADYLAALEAYKGLANNQFVIPAVSGVPGSVSMTYQTYSGLPVIPLTDECFSATDLLKGNPVYVARMDEMHGLQTIIPNDGQILTVIDPRQTATDSVVKSGVVETNIAVAINDLFAIAKGYIKSSSVTFKSFNSNDDWSAPEVTPEVTDDDESFGSGLY